MATNLVFSDGDSGVWPNATPTAVEGGVAPASGLACLVGQKPGVCLNDAGEGSNDSGACDVAIRDTYDLEVTDEATGGIAYGDIVYYDEGDDALTNDPTGNVFYGYARGVVGDGLTATIPISVGY